MQEHTPGIRAQVSEGPSAESLDLRGRGQFANGQEADAATPDAVPPIEVEVAPGAVPAEVRHVAVAADLRDGTQSDNRILTLLVGVFFPEGKQVLDFTRLPARKLDSIDIVPRLGRAVEVENLDLELLDAGALHREFLRGDVVILPVIAAGGNHLVERAAVVHRKRDALGQCHAELQRLADAVAIVEAGVRVADVGEDAAAEKPIEAFGVHALLPHSLHRLGQLAVSEDRVHVDSSSLDRCPFRGASASRRNTDVFAIARRGPFQSRFGLWRVRKLLKGLELPAHYIIQYKDAVCKV